MTIDGLRSGLKRTQTQGLSGLSQSQPTPRDPPQPSNEKQAGQVTCAGSSEGSLGR